MTATVANNTNITEWKRNKDLILIFEQSITAFLVFILKQTLCTIIAKYFIELYAEITIYRCEDTYRTDTNH